MQRWGTVLEVAGFSRGEGYLASGFAQNGKAQRIGVPVYGTVGGSLASHVRFSQDAQICLVVLNLD